MSPDSIDQIIWKQIIVGTLQAFDDVLNDRDGTTALVMRLRPYYQKIVQQANDMRSELIRIAQAVWDRGHKSDEGVTLSDAEMIYLATTIKAFLEDAYNEKKYAGYRALIERTLESNPRVYFITLLATVAQRYGISGSTIKQ